MLPILGLHFPVVKALPLENQLQQASQNHTLLWDTIVTGWSDDPSFRGTSSVLWSCLVTIVASVYTAIHVNIPLYPMKQWDRFMGKAKWAFVALIAPELVLQAAFLQRREARQLIRKLEQIDGQRKQGSDEHKKTRPNFFIRCWQRLESLQHRRKARRDSNFNMAYGFWVVMGGFVADISDIHGNHDRVAPTTHSVALLAEHGYSIELLKEQVADRTKASALAKSLVCIQVLWLLLQVFVRLSAGYPLILLEIHATVHVKPLDVDEPIKIDISSYKDIMAYMLMDSLSTEKANKPLSDSELVRSTKYHSEDDPKGYNFRQPELKLLILNTAKLCGETKYQGETSVTESSDARARASNDPLTQISQKIQDTAIQRLETVATSVKPVVESEEPETVTLAAGAFHSCGLAFDSAVQVSLQPVTVRRWSLCAQALARPGFTDRRREDKAKKRQRIGKSRSNKNSKKGNNSNIVKDWQIGESKRHLVVESFVSLRSIPLGALAATP